jgi:hypothetical protein
MIATEPKRALAANRDADGWFTPWRFAALLAGLIVLSFPNVIFGFETFFYRDFSVFAYPMAFYHREAFWRGEMPMWNPYSFFGLPFLAQWNTMTLYPLSLFYLLFPLSWSLGVFNLGHMFLAGMGMYFLAHRWTGNRLAAAVGGLIYAFNGLTWDALMWSNNIAALGWMPWVVLCAERAWHEGGARNIAMAALVGAMQMLTGAPEVIILTWFALGALWLSEWIAGGVPRWPMILRFFSVGIFVASLAAAQLLPFADLLTHSQRDTHFGTSDWSMPPGGWANYLVPLFHCALGAHDVYTQDSQYWTASYYLGVGTVALALLALWKARERRTWVLAGLAAFSLTMALGEAGGFYAVVRRFLPLMGFMRFPVKFVLLTTFVVPLLAAQAVKWWQTLPAEESSTGQKRLWQMGALLLAAIGFIVWWEWSMHRPGQDEPGLITRNAMARAVFLALILGCLTLLRRAEASKMQLLGRLCLLLLFWFDIFTHAPNLNPTISRSVYEPDQIRQYHMKEGDSAWCDRLRLGVGRAMLTLGALSKMTFEAMDTPANDLYGRRLALWSNANLLEHAPKFDGFVSLTTRHTGSLVTAIYMSTNSGVMDMSQLKDFMNIAEISSTTNAMNWIFRGSVMPIITGGQRPVFMDDASTLSEVMDPNFDPKQAVYLSPEFRPLVSVTNPAPVKITPKSFAAQRIEAEVETLAPAMVVVSQSYYHNWRAYVDGKPTPLVRANFAFQALQVPAGRHEVQLVYEDRMFQLGVVISLASLAICIVFLLFRRKPMPA